VGIAVGDLVGARVGLTVGSKILFLAWITATLVVDVPEGTPSKLVPDIYPEKNIRSFVTATPIYPDAPFTAQEYDVCTNCTDVPPPITLTIYSKAHNTDLEGGGPYPTIYNRFVDSW
jgi:hypothetical protein